MVNLYNIRSFTRLKIPVAQRPGGIHTNKTRKRIQRKILHDSSSDNGSSDPEEDHLDSEDEGEDQKLVKESRHSSEIPFSDLEQSHDDQGIQ